MKRIITALVILCVLSTALFAGGYNYWEIKSPGTSFVRYQMAEKADGDWTVLEQNGQDTVYTDIDMDHPIYVSVSYDGVNWSETTIAYPPKKAMVQQASVLVSPYSFEDILYVKNFEAITSKYGFGGEVDAIYIFSDHMRAGMELGFNTYSLSDKAKFDRLSEVYVGGSIGYQMKMSDILYFVDFDGGVMLDIVGKNALVYAYAGLKSGIEYGITDNLSIKGQIAGKVSFQPEGSKSTAFNLIATPSFGVGYTF